MSLVAARRHPPNKLHASPARTGRAGPDERPVPFFLVLRKTRQCARQAARRFANRFADRFFANIGRSNLTF
jgi:ribosomal protein L39E